MLSGVSGLGFSRGFDTSFFVRMVMRLECLKD